MKRLSILLACGLALILNGCERNTPPHHGSDTLEQVLQRKELRVCYFVQPPAVMRDPNERDPHGTYVDAVKALAEAINVTPKFEEIDIAQFAAGLQSGRYDVCIGPTFRTIGRAKEVAFTNTIYYLGYDGVTKQGRGAEFKTEADINRKGVKVAVKAGSAIETYAKRNYKNAEIITLSGLDLSLPLQAVASGNADVGLMNEHTVEYFARANPGVEIVLGDAPTQIMGLGWSVRSDDPRWLQFLNTSLESLIATGQMAEWERKVYGKPLRRVLEEPSKPSAKQ